MNSVYFLNTTLNLHQSLNFQIDHPHICYYIINKSQKSHNNIPTDPFTVLEPQNALIDIPELHKILEPQDQALSSVGMTIISMENDTYFTTVVSSFSIYIRGGANPAFTYFRICPWHAGQVRPTLRAHGEQVL